MTFTFIDKQNKIVHEVTHRPVQLDVEEEEDEDDEVIEDDNEEEVNDED